MGCQVKKTDKIAAGRRNECRLDGPSKRGMSVPAECADMGEYAPLFLV